MMDGRSLRARMILGAVVVLFASAYLGWDLENEKFFADESAHVAQSYYYRLFMDGDWNHADWLHPAAYDHLPVYKYLIGFSLHRAGYETPTSIRAMEQWFAGNYKPPRDPGVLWAARLPMLLGAIFGCLMMFIFGWQLRGPKTGLLGAFLLATSPLYFRHARLAMDDDLAQAFILASLVAFAGLIQMLNRSVDRRYRFVWLLLGCGIAAGLAPATKLNGAVAGLTVALMTAICLAAMKWAGGETGRFRQRSLLLTVGSVMAGLLAVAVFIGINPYFFARPTLAPIPDNGSAPVVVDGQPRTRELLQHMEDVREMGVAGRLRVMLNHRVEGLQEGQKAFPTMALQSPWQRLMAIVREGMGRWFAGGTGQSELERRHEEEPGREGLRRTAGIQFGISPSIYWVIVFSFVALGLKFAWSDGRAQVQAGLLPQAWLLLAWPGVDVLTLLGNLTLNFDRYYMGVVTWSSLLVAYAISGIWHGFWNSLILAPPVENQEP